MSNIPSGVYPFATQDGKPIPLDIIKSAGFLWQSFIAGVGSRFDIPPDKTVGVLIATTACLVTFGTDLSDFMSNKVYNDTILIPADSPVTVSLIPGKAYVRSLTSPGTLYIQLIEKWAGLALDKQFTRK